MTSQNNTIGAPGYECVENARLVNNSTDKNRQFFAVYLSLWVYVLLMVFATTDQMLLVPTQGIKLPLIDVTLPLLGFYWVAPLFILSIHFNLLQNLESHHYKLMCWRDACGVVPRQEIPAFLFDYEWLEHGSKLEGWVCYGSRILFLHSGPLALGIILWRFTDYQDIVITSWHLLTFIVSTYLVWLTDTAFRKNDRSAQLSKPTIIARFIAHVFAMLVVLQFVFACWLYFSSSEGFIRGWDGIDGRSPHGGLLADSARTLKTTAPRLHSLLIPIINIDPNEAAWIPDKKEIEMQAMLAGEEKAVQWWKDHGVGLNLAGRHLRGFSAPSALLPKLKLDARSNLQGANLEGAQLHGADMKHAELQGVNLRGAQLQGSNLWDAQLQEAVLWDAQLQGADLSHAQLQGANLRKAQLQGADLDIAELQGADLRSAQLQGANLREAQLQGGFLKGAQLQGADLRGAQLQGVEFGTVWRLIKVPDDTALLV